jgi:hypothetical protein
MGVPVVTVTSNGMPVVDVTGTAPQLGMPVTEAANGRGIPVVKVAAGKAGLAVMFVAPPLLRENDGTVDRSRAERLARR